MWFKISELSKMQPVIPGIDIFLKPHVSRKNHRLALVTNNAAKTAGGEMSRVALLKNGFSLVKIFSPEHGITVKGEDGMFQKNIIDAETGLPVISLYGEKLAPDEEDLQDVDAVLFDIPDVGCRFYTYLWTMTHVLEACARFNKPLIILDRPNPIGGDLNFAEGPMLDETACSSFIGRWSMPVRHCCTMGELANYFLQKKNIDAELKIISVKNWQRSHLAGSTGFPFHPTSPAIKNIDTALLYPGTGLLEGINVNEGRGTEKPFLQFGAPWINAGELLSAFVSKNLSGIAAEKISYTPVDSLYKNETCNGLSLSVTDRNALRPVAYGFTIISLLMQLYPEKISERLYKTNANPSGGGHLDKLTGVKNSFILLKAGLPFPTDVSISWQSEISDYLLYD
jgi:uncharacterized protein YbbC (DUF1343 family)